MSPLEVVVYPFSVIGLHPFISLSLCKGGLAITTAACSVSQALYRLIALVGDKHLSMRIMVFAIWCGMATGRQTSAPTLYLDCCSLNMEPVGCGSPRWTLSWCSWTLFVSVKWENGTGAKRKAQTQWRVVSCVTPQRMSVLVLSLCCGFIDFYVVHHTDVEEEGFVKVVDHAVKM